MDSDRKYRQHGYNDSNSFNSNGNGGGGNGQKPKPSGPRPPLDITGPRLPRLVQSVTASRCYNCSAMLAAGSDFPEVCPKCAAQLHCCKQCSHFEPSTRFQCTKPIALRVVAKDQRNECPSFQPRLTVARDVSNAQSGNTTRNAIPGVNAPPPRNASDARDAFDRLFKK